MSSSAHSSSDDMPTKPLQGFRALVVIPGSVSYFYDEEGQRIAQALRNLGAQVDVQTIEHLSFLKRYDHCFLMNLTELRFSIHEDQDFLVKRVRKLKEQCSHVSLVLLESVFSKWFFQNMELFELAGLESLIDIGFLNQKKFCPEEYSDYYRFIFNGLNKQERALASSVSSLAEDRPIPWAFVAHLTDDRLAFIDQFVQEAGPEGLLYLVEFTPVTETSQHITKEQFTRILRRSKFHIWSAHVPGFYLESIRFRYSLLHGCVPIKINYHQETFDSFPFSDLVVPSDGIKDLFAEYDYAETWRIFVDEYVVLPGLEYGLLKELGGESYRAPSTQSSSIQEATGVMQPRTEGDNHGIVDSRIQQSNGAAYYS